MKDDQGFYYTDKELSKDYFKLDKDEFFGFDTNEFKKLLKEEEILYAWDSIRGLAGSAGVAIVKNDRIIKVKGLTRA